MEDASVLISGIEYKIKVLAKKNQILFNENAKLKQQNYIAIWRWHIRQLVNMPNTAMQQ